MLVNSRTIVPASVIVSTRNRPDMLRDVIESVVGGDTIPEELVVVDQSAEANSEIERLQTSNGCRLIYVWSRSQGLARSRNEGARAAGCDVLVFTDDDVLVASDWLQILTGALEQWQPKTVVTGSVHPHEEGVETFHVSVKVDRQRRVQVGRIEDDLLYANMAMHRSVFEDVGPFDERLGAGTKFPGAEDNDYCFRVLDAGYRIVYEPAAIIFHRMWRAPDQYLPLRWRYGVGQGGYYAKHCSLRDRFLLRRMVRDVAQKLVRCVRQIRSRRTEAIGHAVYAVGVVYGASVWFLTERRTR